MDKVTIGIPKALLFYKYGDLWVNFFENLGCSVIISPNTNKEILENGKKYVIDEACLSMKIFMGHIEYLKDKCDYIIVPRLNCVKKREKVCTNFTALYDLVNNLFNVKILNFNVDVRHNEDLEYGLFSVGLSLGYSLKEIKRAYNLAKRDSDIYKNRRITKQNKLLAESNKIKILLAGHPYNLYDNLIGAEIATFLTNNDIDVIYSDNYDTKYIDNDCNKIAPKNYYTFNREIIGAISSFKDRVDGIILITAFPCGPDSLSNEMIIRNIDIPLINLVVDELNSKTGLITRLESFIDILKERNDRYAKESY